MAGKHRKKLKKSKHCRIMTADVSLEGCKKNGYTVMQACIPIPYGESWPDHSDLRCWWCKHCFETVPVPVPVRQGHLQPLYWTVGVCCSWSCVAAYRRSVYPRLSEASLRRFARDVFGCDHREKLYPAPDWRCLKAFGGCLDIHEFRRAAVEQLELSVHTECLKTVPSILCAKHDPSEKIAWEEALQEEKRRMALDRVVTRGGVNVFKRQQLVNGMGARRRTARQRQAVLELTADQQAEHSACMSAGRREPKRGRSAATVQRRRRKRKVVVEDADLHRNYTPSTVTPMTEKKQSFLKKQKTNTLDKLWVIKAKQNLSPS